MYLSVIYSCINISYEDIELFEDCDEISDFSESWTIWDVYILKKILCNDGLCRHNVSSSWLLREFKASLFSANEIEEKLKDINLSVDDILQNARLVYDLIEYTGETDWTNVLFEKLTHEIEVSRNNWKKIREFINNSWLEMWRLQLLSIDIKKELSQNAILEHI